MSKRVISFDLDGTLINWDFAEALWTRGMAESYARRWGLCFSDALNEIKRRYDSVGIERLEWYDINYWWNEFDLPGSWRELAERCKHAIGTYPEVIDVMETLRKECDEMIVVTNGARELSEMELSQSGLKRYVDRLFSVTSDFGHVKNNGAVYSKVLAEIGASPSGVVHVGDNWKFDYIAPREAGILSFYLDRDGVKPGENVVRDLKEFAKIVIEDGCAP
ncbi:MAG: HAD family hydrolase [Candidatus Hadarchaeales archaeon]